MTVAAKAWREVPVSHSLTTLIERRYKAGHSLTTLNDRRYKSVRLSSIIW